MMMLLLLLIVVLFVVEWSIISLGVTNNAATTTQFRYYAATA
jgi:hypothetical protein